MTDLFDTPIARDRWGRPLVIPPTGGNPVGYTRCTTFVGCLEDTSNLSKWKMRMTALGLADRPDLVLSTAAHRGDKRELDRITEDALKAAQAGAAATTGTALHALTEQVDGGKTLGIIPESARTDLDAYAAATASLTYAGIEQFRVEDTLKIGGTCDRLIDFGHEFVIGDIKTGSITWGIGKIAMQLAVYAHSTPYDHATAVRTADAKPMNLDRALIIHLPAGTGECTLHWVDIAAGWEAVQVAADVRKWRARKGLSNPADDITSTTFSPGPTAAPTLLEQVAAITDVAELRNWYVQIAAQGRDSTELLAACQRRKSELEAAA